MRKNYDRGSIEIISAVLILSLIVLLMLAILPGILSNVASRHQSTSANVDKESALCVGDDCTDCAPGDTDCYTTVSTTSTTSAGPGGPGGPGGCFVGDTLVAMADGTLKRIDQIRIGEYVLSQDQSIAGHISRLEGRPVNNVLVHQNEEVVRLVLAGEALDTTMIHPFYVLGHGWLQVKGMAPGDIVIGADGALHEVLGIEILPERQSVYNLSVEGTRTFFVGESLIWVHNIEPSAFGAKLT